MKTKKITLYICCAIGIFTCISLNFSMKKQNAKFSVMLNSIEAFANPEDEPGHYKGAINYNCKKPVGERGCKSDPDPNKICTYSVYCTK